MHNRDDVRNILKIDKKIAFTDIIIAPNNNLGINLAFIILLNNVINYIRESYLTFIFNKILQIRVNFS